MRLTALIILMLFSPLLSAECETIHTRGTDYVFWSDSEKCIKISGDVEVSRRIDGPAKIEARSIRLMDGAKLNGEVFMRATK